MHWTRECKEKETLSSIYEMDSTSGAILNPIDQFSGLFYSQNISRAVRFFKKMSTFSTTSSVTPATGTGGWRHIHRQYEF